jgi:acyl-CoA synthetase (AMP-forming)/AMP-acid ligase II
VQARFGVEEIGEFFASTEGVFTLLNHYRSGFGRGAVGHHGWLLRRKFHDSYIPVKIDPDTGDVWRSPTSGFAQRLPYATGGEILVKLENRASWAGYWGADEATEKKLMEDVFEKGDLYYRTGDALRRDDNGHWYFMDRLGNEANFLRLQFHRGLALMQHEQATHTGGKARTSPRQKSPRSSVLTRRLPRQTFTVSRFHPMMGEPDALPLS